MTSSSSFAEYCSYSKGFDFTVETAALESLSLDVGAGKLTINGNANSHEVRVVAKACASSSRRLEQTDLKYRVRGSDLEVRTEFDRERGILGWLNFGNSYAYVDIEVTMPNNLYLDVHDGSGGIEITDVSALSLDDGSGSIFIENVSGNVSVEDGSGPITISGVNGKVSVSDGSGPINIRDSNEVVIINDGSGEINIEHIRTNVNIYDDGSGSIRIHDVAGNVALGDTGSGSVDVSEVAGTYSHHND